MNPSGPISEALQSYRANMILERERKKLWLHYIKGEEFAGIIF